MVEEEREVEGGISLADIWRAVKRRIWIVLGITVGLALVVSLVFGLVLNPRAAEYRMSFNILFPTSESARYPDGSLFYDSDITSVAFLEEAKNSNEAFAGLDIDRMLKNDGISLSKTKRDNEDAVYTLTVKGLYFKNADVAEAYMRAVAQVPVNRIIANAKTVDYKLDAEVFGGASFEEQIDLLTDLKATLLGACDDWVDLYGTTYSVGGRTLGNYRSALYVVYGESTKKIIKSEFETNGYDGLDLSANATLADAIKARIAALLQEKELNEQILTALREQPVPTAARTETRTSTIVIEQIGNMDTAEMIAYYTKRNAQIDYQTSMLTETNVKNYITRLSDQFGELQTAAETVAGVTSLLYEQNTKVNFISRRAEKVGGTNIVLVVVAALVVSFIVGTIVACAVEAKKKAKTSPAQNATDKREE